MPTVSRRSAARMPGCAAPRAGSVTGLAVLAILVSSAPKAAEEPVFKWGFKERVRQEYIENGFALEDGIEDEWNAVRVRSQLWFRYAPRTDLQLYASLNNEHRHWFKSNRGYEDQDFEIDEFIFENLYVTAEKIGGSPFSVTAGRQNIMFGEGFLFMDGGPLDGSRTGYFNAVRVKAKKGPRSFEVILLSDPSFDKYLPTLNCQLRPLIEYDEKGAALYYTDSSFMGRKLEAYYIYKNEEDDDAFPRSDIHTIGARSSGKLFTGLEYAAELAFQFGDRERESRSAQGGYLRFGHVFEAPMKPRVSAGFIYLSGDDPDTGKYEGWNPLFGRWPIWSELYIYTLVNEHGIAYWDNLAAPNLSLELKPAEKVAVEGSVYFMSAPEEDPFSGSGAPARIFGGGDSRGVLSTLKVKWSFRKHLSGHFLWERFAPGDYYAETSDTAHFLRWEILFAY